jgi:hypothetical protein
MNDTQADTELTTKPSDPAMAASDPGMFASLTVEDNHILRAHLISGWYKQSAVYPALSEPWKETAAVLTDLAGAWDAAYQAGREAEAGQ